MKLVGIIGWKNSGKTTLIESLVTHFSRGGLSVSTIKHAHHVFDIDQPGKDSFRHREAGAREVLIASATRWALLHELREADEPDLDMLLTKLTPVDLVIVEGFKRHAHMKLEVRRVGQTAPLLAPDDADIAAVIADYPLIELELPVLPLNEPARVARFIADRLDLGL